MKKLFFITVLSLVFAGIAGFVLANSDHTAREEAEGRAIWEKFTNKEITCAQLTDENFGALGEFFMGQMMGVSHEAMNNMMIQMMGEKGEEQMHVVMGKRMSGCGVSAEFPQGGWTSMMQGMGGGMMGGGMMGNFGLGVGLFGWTLLVFWWVLIILGIVGIIALIKRLSNKK